jgi:hypothetical protein
MSRIPRTPVAAAGERSPLPALVLRLLVCAAAVALVLAIVEPLLYAALGRIARDLVVFSTAVPRIEDVVWAGDQFAVSSPLYRGVMGVTAPWFAMAVGVPLAFAASLPGAWSAAGARRCAAIALAALAIGGIALANNVLAGLVPTLARRGLAVLPPWRAAFHVRAQDGLWEFAMVLLPAALCLAAALPLLPWQPRDAAPPAKLPGRARRAALALALWLALAAVVDRAASARLARADADALLAELEPYNPELGAFLLRVGEEELAAGHRDAALASFRLALRHPAYAREANAALERLRSVP